MFAHLKCNRLGCVARDATEPTNVWSLVMCACHLSIVALNLNLLTKRVCFRGRHPRNILQRSIADLSQKSENINKKITLFVNVPAESSAKTSKFLQALALVLVN